MEKLIKDLKKSALFENVCDEKIKSIINSVNYRLINLDKNEIIFNAFSYASSIGIILSGNMQVEKILSCGKQVVFFQKSVGEIFGEVAVFSRQNEYPCDVVAKSSCRVIIFSKEEFMKIIYSNKTILNNLLYLISDKAFSLNLKVESLCLPTIRKKIAHSLFKDFNVCYENTVVKLPFSKKTWADKLNISRASLYRELDCLSCEMIIKINNSNCIKVLDVKKLNSIL